MDFKTLKNKLVASDKRFAKVYSEQDLPFDISQMILEARIEKGLTQKELAKLIKTKQSGIARAESGRGLPSLTLLVKIAKALDVPITIKFGNNDNPTINKFYRINLNDISLERAEFNSSNHSQDSVAIDKPISYVK